MKTCPDCNGDGVIEKGTDDEQRCPTCGGLGFVADDNGDNEEEAIQTSGDFNSRHKPRTVRRAFPTSAIHPTLAE